MRILQTDEDWQEPEKQTSLQFDNPKYIISMHDIIIDNIVTGVFFVKSFNASLSSAFSLTVRVFREWRRQETCWAPQILSMMEKETW